MTQHQAGRRQGGDAVGIGIEGTLATHSGRDTLQETGHFDQWRDDLRLINQLGVAEVRYPLGWHRVEPERGRRDWAAMDETIDFLTRDLGLRVIADPLHHTVPAWFQDGFLDPALVDAYPDFVQEFAERYPQVAAYAPFNEPTATLDFCGGRAWWHPYRADDHSYVAMLRNAALATAEAIRRIAAARPDAEIIHVDTCEHHAALDPASQPRAEFLNHRRFLFDELLLGRVGEDHPLYAYVAAHGFPVADLAGLRERPVRIDVRGLNYYKLNEEQLLDGATCHAPSRRPRGFAEVAWDYHLRLGLPLRLTETNIQGYVTDRISWLKYMREQYEQLRARLPVGRARGFDWYPLFDCKGWHSLLQAETWPWDPQGIYWCDDRNARHASELSHWYTHLAAGGASADLPAYEFQPALAAELEGFMPQMAHWRWVAAG